MKSKIIDFSNLRRWRSGRWGAYSPLHWCAIRNGATAGLYGAIMVGIFAAIFGGTPTQASYWTNDSSACVQFGVWKQLWELYLSSSRWSFANYFGLITSQDM
jgi:hypothetical protein